MPSFREKIKNWLEPKISESRVEANERRLNHQHARSEKINLVCMLYHDLSFNNVFSFVQSCIQDPDIRVTLVQNFHYNEPLRFSHLWRKRSLQTDCDFSFLPKILQGTYSFRYTIDPVTRKRLPLRSLQPHYVIYFDPYGNDFLPAFRPSRVSSYAKVGFIFYGFNNVTEKNFAWDNFFDRHYPYAHFIFADTKELGTYWLKQIRHYHPWFPAERMRAVGNCTSDIISRYQGTESSLWKHPRSARFRILWNPRWNASESSFLDYRETLLTYAESHACDLCLRNHSSLFNGCCETEWQQFLARLNQSSYGSRENDQKFETLWSSDVLVSDLSGLVFEYFLTGKPIVFTHKDWTQLNEAATRLYQKIVYPVHSQQELIQTLEMLRSGNDPLREQRLQAMKEQVLLPKEGVGNTIKNIIKKDFYDCGN